MEDSELGEPTMRQPMLDPKRDLAGATPETLCRALFRRVEPPKQARRKTTEKRGVTDGRLTGPDTAE